MKLLYGLALALLLCSAFQTPAFAQHADAFSDTLVIKATGDFEITGKGLAREWKNAATISLSRRKGTADYRTTARLLHSGTGLYALFSCQDEKITATLREDFGELWKEDVIEIFLWPDTSVPIYFEYELSPLNYELPILIPNLDGKFYGWRPWQYDGSRRIRHATHIERDSQGKAKEWIAEFFIPYALLTPLQNIPPSKGTLWRMNAYRNDYDQGYTSWSWKPVDKNYHDYEKFGVIRFE